MRIPAPRLIIPCACLAFCSIGLFAQSAAHYQEVWYTSGKLRIQAYLYAPAGRGPFPVVIYNHGSQWGAERSYAPMTAFAQMLVDSGYMVLEPTRRGYGRSDGPTASETVGSDRGDAYITRLREDADDVVAAEASLKTIRSADLNRVAMMGTSEGGTATIIAAGESPGRVACIIDQAGGAGSWDRSPQLQQALRTAAANIHIPVLGMVAENDSTIASVRAVVENVQKANTTAMARLIVYPPYTLPAEERAQARGRAAGHRIFSPKGMSIWAADVRVFLARCLQTGNR